MDGHREQSLPVARGSYLQSDWPAGVRNAYQRGVSRAARGIDDAAEGPLSTDYCEVYSQVIGFPGKVQSHGVFFLLEEHGAEDRLGPPPGLIIKAVSTNSPLFFQGTAEALLGTSFPALFKTPDALESALAKLTLTPKVADGLTPKVAAPENMPTSNPLTLQVALPPIGKIRTEVTIQLQRGPNGIIADVEEIDPVSPWILDAYLAVHQAEMLQAANAAAASLATCDTDAALAHHVARDVFRIFGYDRVLVMKFQEDHSSYVLAESRSTAVKNSFLNMYFPGSDIASSARNRLLKKKSSVVVDAMDTPAAIITGDPALDPNHILLSMSSLKSMHAGYLEQLGTWGMRSSLTLSVLCDGKLWGMVTAHGRGATRIGAHPRLAVEMLCEAFSTRLTVLEEQAKARDTLKCTQLKIILAYRVLEATRNVSEAGPEAYACVEALCTPGATILDLLEEDTLGCSVVLDSKVVSDGATPNPEDVLKIAQAMSALCESESVQSESEGGCPTVAVQAISSLGLGIELPEALRTAACLYAPTPGAAAILVFRNGEMGPMRWAGKVEAGVAGAINKKTGTLHPRADIAEVAVDKAARPWLKSSRDRAASLATFVGELLDPAGPKVPEIGEAKTNEDTIQASAVAQVGRCFSG